MLAFLTSAAGPEPVGFTENSRGCWHPRNRFKYGASRSDATVLIGLHHRCSRIQLRWSVHTPTGGTPFRVL
jgi:hypothetical protein